jgi:hypothetical protein
MNPRKGARLYPQDLDAIHALARVGFLDADQLRRYYYPNYSEVSAAYRFARLTVDGFLTRTATYPRSTPNKIGRPSYVYYWAPTNQTRLKTYFEETAQASEWHRSFAYLAPLNNHEYSFAQQFLAHETDISEYFLSVEHDAPRHQWELVFAERTSPFSKDLRQASGLDKGKLTITVSVRKTRNGQAVTETRDEQINFNPDGFYCLRDPANEHHFFFHEEDNNTSQPRDFRKKLIGYDAFDTQGYWLKCLAHYIARYQLPISGNLARVGFRVTTATPDETRRDTLFLDSLTLRSYKRLLFASMTDVTPTTALAPIWTEAKSTQPSSRSSTHCHPRPRLPCTHASCMTNSPPCPVYP